MNAYASNYDIDDAVWIEPEPLRSGTKRMRRWRQRNSAKARMQSQVANYRTKARHAGLAATLTVAEWLRLIEEADGCCLACGDRPASLSIGHVIPHARGGPLTLENVQPLCMPCNRRQGLKTVDYRRNHEDQS